MKKFLNHVTITGADESVLPSDLVSISRDFPFVEWGILLSCAVSQPAMVNLPVMKYSEFNLGKPRYPGPRWLNSLFSMWQKNNMLLSGHICGRWVREICKGNWEILKDFQSTVFNYSSMFQRFQLNFRPYMDMIVPDKFVEGCMDNRLSLKQFVFQVDSLDTPVLTLAKSKNIDAAGLFDLSGGKGMLPESWPKVEEQCGFAGGLTPDNLENQLALMEQVVGDHLIWIDAESGLFTNEKFDLNKVVKFLEIAKPFVWSVKNAE